MSDIFLVRHAQSLNNALGEDGRVPDPPLTEIGAAQAAKLKDNLAELSADVFLVSAFRRALETASPFAQAHGAKFQVWRELHEVGGCYSGRTGQEKAAQPGMTPDCVRGGFDWAHPEATWTSGGWNRLDRHESVEDAIPRVQRMAQQLVSDFGETQQRIILVSHAEFISLLLAHLTGIGEPFFVRPRSIYNTAVTHIRLESGQCRLIEFNRVCHLEGSRLTS